mmetsp:Transcript_2890/g.7934  ORF Transcript_2890/g.7934 Transcript_2890/m.7934 type:complete len:200 (+) Transcript_2890:304-903(+)
MASFQPFASPTSTTKARRMSLSDTTPISRPSASQTYMRCTLVAASLEMSCFTVVSGCTCMAAAVDLPDEVRAASPARTAATKSMAVCARLSTRFCPSMVLTSLLLMLASKWPSASTTATALMLRSFISRKAASAWSSSPTATTGLRARPSSSSVASRPVPNSSMCFESTSMTADCEMILTTTCVSGSTMGTRCTPRDSG